MLLALCVQAQGRKYFCEIKGIEKELSAGLKVVFDFGNSPVYSIWGGLKSKQKLVDDTGQEIKFNSMVDAANYMAEKGWQFQQAYSSVYSGRLVQHWIFFKEADSPEEAAEGIMTKKMYKEKSQDGMQGLFHNSTSTDNAIKKRTKPSCIRLCRHQAAL